MCFLMSRCPYFQRKNQIEMLAPLASEEELMRFPAERQFDLMQIGFSYDEVKQLLEMFDKYKNDVQEINRHNTLTQVYMKDYAYFFGKFGHIFFIDDCLISVFYLELWSLKFPKRKREQRRQALSFLCALPSLAFQLQVVITFELIKLFKDFQQVKFYTDIALPLFKINPYSGAQSILQLHLNVRSTEPEVDLICFQFIGTWKSCEWSEESSSESGKTSDSQTHRQKILLSAPSWRFRRIWRGSICQEIVSFIPISSVSE